MRFEKSSKTVEVYSEDNDFLGVIDIIGQSFQQFHNPISFLQMAQIVGFMATLKE